METCWMSLRNGILSLVELIKCSGTATTFNEQRIVNLKFAVEQLCRCLACQWKAADDCDLTRVAVADLLSCDGDMIGWEHSGTLNFRALRVAEKHDVTIVVKRTIDNTVPFPLGKGGSRVSSVSFSAHDVHCVSCESQ